MKFAYADPPYIGMAKRYYNSEEVDHLALIHRLVEDFPDGWALSCSQPSLTDLLALCPDDVRIGVWVKPFVFFRPGVRVAYAWEPVIFHGGRKGTRKDPTVRDWVSANTPTKTGVPGSKPEAFCRWLFDLWMAQPGDTLDDLFPGTGIVSRTWDTYLAEGGVQ